MPEIGLGGRATVFKTVTATAADVTVLPAASRATAVRVCEPSATAVVVHEREYGAARSSVPTVTPSTLNRTPATATLSLAFAVSVTVPDAVTPAAGEVSATDGRVTSSVLNVKSPDRAALPAASRERTRK